MSVASAAMSHSSSIVTREALYALVWAESMSKVAPKFGLSDRGLAKVCESRNIPVPQRGYWAKLTHGHQVKQPLLPPWRGRGDGRMHLGGEPKPPRAEEPPDPPEIAFERQPENRIVVPQRLGESHRLVARTRALLHATKEDEHGRLYGVTGALNVEVSRALLPRALRIMNALVVALEQRGHQVTVGIGAREKQFTFADVLGEKIGFRIIERLKRVRAKPTDYRWKYMNEDPERKEPWDPRPDWEVGARTRRVVAEQRR